MKYKAKQTLTSADVTLITKLVNTAVDALQEQLRVEALNAAKHYAKEEVHALADREVRAYIRQRISDEYVVALEPKRAKS